MVVHRMSWNYANCAVEKKKEKKEEIWIKCSLNLINIRDSIVNVKMCLNFLI